MWFSSSAKKLRAIFSLFYSNERPERTPLRSASLAKFLILFFIGFGVAQVIAQVGTPSAPTYSSLTATSVTVAVPTLPSGATSLTLQKKLSTASSYTNEKTGLTQAGSHTASNLIPNTTYTFRFVALPGPVNGTPSNVTTRPTPAPPASPVSFTEVKGTSLKVTAPTLPSNALSLRLERKLQGAADTTYGSFVNNIAGGTVTSVSGLTVGTAYTFRYSSVSGGAVVPGPSANISTASLPGVPAAPSFNTIKDTSLNCVAPIFPSDTTSFKLWRKSPTDTSFQEIASNLTAGSTRNVTNLLAGANYSFYYQAIGPGGATNGVQANVTTVPRPANDNFGNAHIITSNPGSITGTNLYSTTEAGEGNHNFNTPRSTVWYRWTPSQDGRLSIRCATPDFEPVLAVYTGSSLNALTYVNSNSGDLSSPCRLSFPYAAGTTYSIVVGRTSLNQTGSFTLSWTEYIDPPDEPSYLRAFSGNGQVSLQWATAPRATHYVVYRVVVPNSSQETIPYWDTTLATVNAPSTSYVDLTPTNGVRYQYRVRSFNDEGQSYDRASALAISQPEMAAPEIYSLQGWITNNTVSPRLHWFASSGANQYLIYRRTETTAYSAPVATLSDGGTFWIDSALPVGGIYFYKVVGLNGFGQESPPSKEVGIGTTIPPLSNSDIKVIPGDAQAWLSWKKIPGVVSCRVVRRRITATHSNGSYSFDTEKTIHTDSASIHDTGLQNDQEYFYSLYLRNATGENQGSDSSRFFPRAKPAAVSNVTAVGRLNDQSKPEILLNWDVPQTTAQSKILRSRTPDGAFSEIQVVYESESRIIDGDVEFGTTYYYKIQRNRDGVLSDESSIARAVTPPPAPFVARVAATKVSLRTPALPYSATSYTLYRSSQTALPTFPTNGLAHWYRADTLLSDGKNGGDSVEKWLDLSGNRRHAFSEAAEQRPSFLLEAQGGRSSLRFNGVNALHIQDSVKDLPNGLTTYVVFRADKDQPTPYFRLYELGPPYAFGTTFFGLHNDGFGLDLSNGYVVKQDKVKYEQFQIAGASQSLGVPGQNTPSILRIDGVEEAAYPAPLIANVERKVGSIGNRLWGDRGLKGAISEILIYDRALSQIEREQLEQHLSYKYSLGDVVTKINPNPVETWVPVVANLQGNITYEDTGLSPQMPYRYRLEAQLPPMGSAATAVVGTTSAFLTTAAVPTAPTVPVFSEVNSTSLLVAPQSNAGATNGEVLALQRKKAGEPLSAFRSIDVLPAGSSSLKVVSLESGTAYSFRFVAIADHAHAFGPEADVTTPSATSGSGGGLLATYYNTKNFALRAATKVDPTIDFFWGYLSPTQGVNQDRFSVRWQGQIQPQFSEQYTFHTPLVSYDGVKVWVNGNQIINGSMEGNTSSAPISLIAGQKYDIQIEYVEDIYHAGLKLEWESVSQPRQIVPSDRLFLPQGNGTGLRGQYFNGAYFQNQAFARTDAQLDFGFPDRGIDSRLSDMGLSILWSGQITPRFSETYTLSIKHSGATKLWINGQLKNLTSTQVDGILLQSASIDFIANQPKDIQISYSLGGQKAPQVELLWSSSSQAPQTVPYFCLTPSSSDVTPPPLMGEWAQFMGTTVASDLLVGTSTSGTVTFKNRGTQNWSQGRYKLRQSLAHLGVVTNPDGTRYWSQILDSHTDIELPQNVSPDEEVVFNVSFTPSVGTTGAYWEIIDTQEQPFQRIPAGRWHEINLAYSLSAPEVVKASADLIRLKMPRLPAGASSFALQRATSAGMVKQNDVEPTNPSLWWRADSAVVNDQTTAMRWKSRVGLGVALQTNQGRVPLLIPNGLQGRPVIRFDGSNDDLSTNVTGPGGNAFTVFTVTKAATHADYRSVVSFDGSGGYMLYPFIWGGTNQRWRISNDDQGIGQNNVVARQGGRWNISVASWESGAQARSWNNGVSDASWSANTSPLPDVPLWIGTNAAETERFKGDLAEVLIYNRALSTQERESIERYLSGRHGIATADNSAPSGWTTIATDLQNEQLFDDSTVVADTTYWYRVVAAGMNSPAAMAVTDSSSIAAPEAPGAPANGVSTTSKITVTAPGPAWPARTSGLVLQMKLPHQSDEEYADIEGSIAPDETKEVSNLSPDTTYRFRFVAVGEGGRTASTEFADYTTSNGQNVGKPGKPVISDLKGDTTSEYDRRQVTVTLPELPNGATSLRLEWDGGSYAYDPPATTFFTMPEGTVVPDTPVVVPGSTQRTALEVLTVRGLLSEFYRRYTFRVVAVGPAGETPSDAVAFRMDQWAPGTPPEPRIRSVGSTWVAFVSPSGFYTGLRLQMRPLDSPEANWQTIVQNIGTNQNLLASQLTAGESYDFRYVCVQGGDVTPGPQITVSLSQNVVLWRAGSPIECKGIRWPQAGATISSGAMAKIGAYVGVDFDSRDTLAEDASPNLMLTSRFTDSCRYTWYCSNAIINAGGGFPNGVGLAGTSVKQNPVFKAPTTPGTYTLQLIVDDAGGSIANGENGARDDASLGYNDAPLKFSVTFTVQ